MRAETNKDKDTHNHECRYIQIKTKKHIKPRNTLHTNKSKHVIMTAETIKTERDIIFKSSSTPVMGTLTRSRRYLPGTSTGHWLRSILLMKIRYSLSVIKPELFCTTQFLNVQNYVPIEFPRLSNVMSICNSKQMYWYNFLQTFFKTKFFLG